MIGIEWTSVALVAIGVYATLGLLALGVVIWLWKKMP